MLDGGKINSTQAGLLMFSFLLGSAILMIPSSVTSLAQQDGWLSIILGTLLGIGIVYIYTTLGLMFPTQNIIQYSETILGKWIGKGVGLLYIWFPFHLGSLVLRNSTDYVRMVGYPDTPTVVISGIFLVVIAYAIRGGIETLGRVNEVTIPFRELTVLCVIIFSLKEFKWENITPILADGVQPVLNSSLLPATFPFGETILFAMILPNISNIDKIKKSYFISILAGGFLLTISVLLAILVLGPTITSRLNFPTHSVIRYINIADFITNLDAFGMLLWTSSNFIKIAICYYCAVIGIAQWFKLSDYKSIVNPVGVLMLIFSITLYKNHIEHATFAIKIWPFYSLPFELLLPLLMLIVSKIRRLDKIKQLT